MISYFFLGPLFLFAKSGTPLADSYVRGHAKRASMIIGLTLISFIVYLFLKSWINFSIPGIGIHIHTIILASIIALCSIFLISGAYRAYHGWVESDVRTLPSLELGSHREMIRSDEDKIRILASIIPLVGISIAKKSPSWETVRGRIIGSCFLFLYFVSIFFTGAQSLISFLLITSFILYFVIEAVYIFVYEEYLSWDILDRLPSYEMVHASMVAAFLTIFDFFRVAFGGEKKSSWKSLIEEETIRGNYALPSEPYFMPIHLIGIPFFNLFTLPSLFIEKYKPYRKIILEGLMITALWIYVLFFLGNYTHILLLLSLFPIAHILIYGKSSLALHTPILSLLSRIFESLARISSLIMKVQKKEENESFTYEQK